MPGSCPAVGARIWLYSLLSGMLGLCLLAALAGSLEARELTGLWQRLLCMVLFLWCAVFGVWADRRPGVPESHS